MRIKNYKSSLILFILLNAIAETSIASDWKLVTDNDERKMYVDIQSLRINGSKVRVWEKWVFARPQKVIDSSPMKMFNSSRLLITYRCDKMDFAIHKINEYDDKNASKVVNRILFPDPPSFVPIIPGTMGENVFKFVCSINKETQKQR
jgi:hypothetical protein